MEGHRDALEFAAPGVQPGMVALNGTSGSYGAPGLRQAEASHHNSATHVQCKRPCHRAGAAGAPAATPPSVGTVATAAGGCPPSTAEVLCETALGGLQAQEQPWLVGKACGLSGGDAATLLDLQELLLLPPSQQPDLCELLTGHESDGSGCSGGSHLSVPSAGAPLSSPGQPLLRPASPSWLMPTAAHQQQEELTGSLLDSNPALLAEKEDGLHEGRGSVTGPAALCGWLEPGWDSASAADASDSDMMQWFVNAVADSSTSSSPERSQQEHAPASMGAAHASAPAGMLGQSGAGVAGLYAALSSSTGSATAAVAVMGSCGEAACAPGAKKRGRGRPRRYDTTLPLLPGLMEAQTVGAMSNQVNGMDEGQRKKTRGAKPKYKFQTAEEAVAYRRERNRTTALASYEKRKAHETALKAQIAALAAEQDALKRLLAHVQQNKIDQERLHSLLAAADGSPARVLYQLKPGQRC